MKRQLHQILRLAGGEFDAVRVLLGWAALPIVDRRWAAPLSAVALGFGLFVGVAIGPGAAGTFATGAAQVIEIPLLGGEEDEETAAVSAPRKGSGDQDEGGGAPSPAPASTAFAGSEEEASAPVETEPAPPPEVPAPPEEETEPEEQVLTGTVVHVNPAAGSYTLAEAGGALDVVHAAKLPQATTRLSVLVRPLADGTFAEARTRTRLGTRSRATIEGIVTYVDSTSSAPAYAVSKRGVSLFVRVHPDPAGAAPALPVLGAFVKVAVDVERPPTAIPLPSEAPVAPPEVPVPPTEAPVDSAEGPNQPPPPPACAADPARAPPPTPPARAALWQRHLGVNGAPFAYGDFAGIVMAVCPDSGQLLLSADDIRESGVDLLLGPAAEEIDLAGVRVGDSVLVTAEIRADGSLALTGLEPPVSRTVHRPFTTP